MSVQFAGSHQHIFRRRSADMPDQFGPALSEKTMQIIRWTEKLKNPISPSRLESRSSNSQKKTLEEQLFDAVSRAMIAIASVGMHLDKQWREMLIAQINGLHDLAEWYKGDEPLGESSFRTFLKAILQIKPERRPGLGLSSEGNLIAAWTRGRNQLTIEFLRDDRVRWVINRSHDGESERFAAMISVSRLLSVLQPHDPGYWFFGEG